MLAVQPWLVVERIDMRESAGKKDHDQVLGLRLVVRWAGVPADPRRRARPPRAVRGNVLAEPPAVTARADFRNRRRAGSAVLVRVDDPSIAVLIDQSI